MVLGRQASSRPRRSAGFRQEEGIPMEKYYREKFGEQGAAMARDMNATRFGRMGTALGLSFAGAKKAVNTKRTHLLMEWAADQSLEKQHDLAEVLFKYHFAEGRDVNTVETLVEAAKEVGLDGKKAQEAMEDRNIISQVDTMLMSARTKGINGVPHFHVSTREGKTFELSGAQPPDTFIQIFDRLVGAGQL